ncbi:MAG: adenylosuccinate lyase [Planctomycetes bacterium]|nr:adenylosuccinate lyase [Planctomycetota bacterium]
MSRNIYENPLVTRYASREMCELFSMEKRIRSWRQLWIALAEAEQELGLPITKAQISEMKKFANEINWQVAEKREREVRHDVMAHVHAFGQQAKKAAPIIHLGATSCYVTDNADLMILRAGLQLLAQKTAAVINNLAGFSRKYKKLPILGLTHLQPAQPTTVGKRATLWLQDFLLDLQELEARITGLPARGIKGATGTQASFLALFDGNHRQVERLDKLVVKKLGFRESIAVSGQTYTRKLDSQILAALAGIAESAHKFATDIRILAHRKEIEEPFGKQQIGSSAMAYKRNPMRCERICALARFVMTMPLNSNFTHATQWLERTLDDSANRRLSLPQAFLAADAILELSANVADGLVVYKQVIAKNLRAELPFLATEDILMAAVRAGGNRQKLHEQIRIHSQAAAAVVKVEGGENDLLDRLSADPAFAKIKGEWKALLDPRRYIGRAPEQVDAFLKNKVNPLLRRYNSKAASTGKAVRV